MAARIAPPAQSLTTRFAADLAGIWHEGTRGTDAQRAPRDTGTRLGLAVSGGPDSLALLLLAHAARPGGIAAATVDHGLRPASATEAAEVARICAVLGVPHTILRVTVSDGNLQAAARSARYAALAAWLADHALGALATAHHADDQAETLLMRLNRASGVAGLAGVRARGQVPRTTRLLLRPLLGWRRHDLHAVVAAAGQVAARDPGNTDDRFDRARIRGNLASADWLNIPAIAASAAHLADADGALEWAAAREWQERVTTSGLGLTYRPIAPRAIALRVLARMVVELDGAEPRGAALVRVFDALVARQPASIGDLVARPLSDGWSFTRAPQRRGADRTITDRTISNHPIADVR